MIELKGVCAGYGAKPVLRDLSLSLLKGGVTAVIGANGSGKSTLLKTVVGIIAPSSGEISIENMPAADLSRQEIARRVSYLAQGRNVPDLTVEQMVLHGRFPHLSYPRRYGRKDREIAGRALGQMGIAELSDRPLSTLSGGMRQKAYIAMALTQDTDYILLDEPTAYLDISGQLELMKILRGLAAGGKGVVAVLHDLPLAFSCSDRIAVLKDGGILLCDTPEAVCKSGAVRAVFGVELQCGCSEASYHYKYSLG